MCKKFHQHYFIGVIMLMKFFTIPISSSLAIENLTQWWSPEFEFNNPGARSRGIGSAFVGKADDATAAIYNPAGLAQLSGVHCMWKDVLRPGIQDLKPGRMILLLLLSL
ncbi:MAG: hypothetical protein MRK02_15560 [Candidatus Scalindua sp.]|nr:hypothetical protein [Candidatus Scalindua sp.]